VNNVLKLLAWKGRVRPIQCEGPFAGLLADGLAGRLAFYTEVLFITTEGIPGLFACQEPFV
jgi:hypothetical protein